MILLYMPARFSAHRTERMEFTFTKMGKAIGGVDLEKKSGIQFWTCEYEMLLKCPGGTE